MKEFEMGSLNKFNKRYLFPLEKEYLSKIKEWRNSQINILRQWKPLTESNQKKWFEQIPEDETQVIFAIKQFIEPNNMDLIGYCGIVNIDLKNKRGEISFLVNPKRAENNSLYREDYLSVLFMLCQYGFEELNLHKLFTETFALRDWHIKILEEFGFHNDNVLRDHQFIHGKYFDSLIHSILEHDWPEIKERIKNLLGK